MAKKKIVALSILLLCSQVQADPEVNTSADIAQVVEAELQAAAKPGIAAAEGTVRSFLSSLEADVATAEQKAAIGAALQTAKAKLAGLVEDRATELVATIKNAGLVSIADVKAAVADCTDAQTRADILTAAKAKLTAELAAVGTATDEAIAQGHALSTLIVAMGEGYASQVETALQLDSQNAGTLRGLTKRDGIVAAATFATTAVGTILYHLVTKK